MALMRDHMHQDRPGILRIPHIAQDRQQMVQVMAVDRAHVIEAQLLEQRAAGQQPAGIFLGPLGGALQAPGEFLRHPAGDLAQAQEALTADDARQIGAHGAHRRRDGHLVVVQDHDQARFARAGIVHGLVGHAGAHRAVADHRHHVPVLVAMQLVCHREAQARGNAGRAMCRTERVVLALAAPGETGQPALLPQCADAVTPPGQDLVRVGLVADVPDHLVDRRIEHGVQRHGELDHAERGAQMPAGHRNGIDRLRPQLMRELLELLRGEIPHVRGHPHAVQQRGGGTARTLGLGRAIGWDFFHTLSAPAGNDPGRKRAQPVRLLSELL